LGNSGKLGSNVRKKDSQLKTYNSINIGPTNFQKVIFCNADVKQGK